jgi:hypothetical protein
LIIGTLPTWTTTATSGVFTLREAQNMRTSAQWPRGPAAPTSLTATVGNGQLLLSWTAPATTHGTITNYLVEYTASGGSAQYVLTGSTSTSYTLAGLTNGTSYSVRVAAVNFTAGDYSGTATRTPVANTDPLYANVSLLLNFDGTNGQKTYADQSSNARTLTSSFHSLTTAQKKFGTASLQLDGGGNALSGDLGIPAGVYPSGTQSHCIEFWFFGSLFLISSSQETYGSSLKLDAGYKNNWNASFASDFGGWNNVGFGSDWQHIALVRDGNQFRIYADGVLQASGTLTETLVSEVVYLQRKDNEANSASGYLDSLRITLNHPRYTSNFAKPTQAFAP